MRSLFVAGTLSALLLGSALALAQQPETGPGTPPNKDAHPMRTQETGTRGPSGGSPDTGPHGPRDVTKDAEPGKAKTADELRKTGQMPENPKQKKN